jgi:hypothetical protein
MEKPRIIQEFVSFQAEDAGDVGMRHDTCSCLCSFLFSIEVFTTEVYGASSLCPILNTSV